MSTRPHRCRWIGCEDEQVEHHLCVQHAALLARATGELDAEPMERDR